jgi:Predicted metal-binding, possibly nucleic acid-binding protein
MKVDISEITKANGASLDLNFDEILGNGGLLLEGCKINKPVSFSGSLTNMNGILELDGRLKTGYNVKCYRCLKDMDRQLDIKIRESIINSKADSNDPDAYTYNGNLLELDKILEDNMVLNLPMKHLCTQECKGLCKFCGADLNNEPCNCKEDSTNPQMESLRNFFNN